MGGRAAHSPISSTFFGGVSSAWAAAPPSSRPITANRRAARILADHFEANEPLERGRSIFSVVIVHSNSRWGLR